MPMFNGVLGAQFNVIDESSGGALTGLQNIAILQM